MIQEYNCYGDGDMIALKQGRGNWVRYSDHLAEVERAIDVAIKMMSNKPLCPDFPCRGMLCEGCLKTRVMDELKDDKTAKA